MIFWACLKVLIQADKLFKLSPKRNLKVAYELESKKPSEPITPKAFTYLATQPGSNKGAVD